MRQIILLSVFLLAQGGAFFLAGADPVPVPAVPPLKEAADKDPYLYKEITFFLRAMTIIRQNYVDREKVTDEKLLQAALRGMLRELDPFSRYEAPDSFKMTKENTAGKFAGIGVTLRQGSGGALQIVSVMEDSPAKQAGILPGDRITEIDGKMTAGMTLRESVTRLKGKPDTKVTVKICRGKNDAHQEYTLIRRVIRIPSVCGTKVIDGDYGYLRIAAFSQTTAADLDKALEELEKKKVKGIVIDLRNNPGGLLESAIEVSSRFLPKGTLVVYTEGQAERAKQKYYAVDSKKYPDIPLILLVNGNSASAAEIFAGCLQDHSRAVLLGSKTFGKGSVQTVIPLADKGAMRLTTARYHTPRDRMIHGKGIMPDIVVPMSPAAEARLAVLLQDGSDIVRRHGEDVHDVQLERALELLKGVNLFLKNRKSE